MQLHLGGASARRSSSQWTREEWLKEILAWTLIALMGWLGVRGIDAYNARYDAKLQAQQRHQAEMAEKYAEEGAREEQSSERAPDAAPVSAGEPQH